MAFFWTNLGNFGHSALLPDLEQTSTHQPLGFKMPTEISTYIKDYDESYSYNRTEMERFIVTSVQYR